MNFSQRFVRSNLPKSSSSSNSLVEIARFRNNPLHRRTTHPTKADHSTDRILVFRRSSADAPQLTLQISLFSALIRTRGTECRARFQTAELYVKTFAIGPKCLPISSFDRTDRSQTERWPRSKIYRNRDLQRSAVRRTAGNRLLHQCSSRARHSTILKC